MRLASAQDGLRHVFLRDMVLPARIGVHPHERTAAQRVRINVDLAVREDEASSSAPSAMGQHPPSHPPVGQPPEGPPPVVQPPAGEPPAGQPMTVAEELARVVDYEAIAQRVRAIVGERHVRLVETLAEALAAACLSDPRVRIVRIRVEKLDVFPDAASAGVEIERRQTNLSTS